MEYNDVLPFIQMYSVNILNSSLTLMDKKFGQILKKYLKMEGRLQKQLVIIVSWVTQSTIDQFVKHLQKIISQPLVWDHFFKILIMINNLIVNQQINQQTAFYILSNMNILKFENNQFENILINNLLQPYRLYLQKRCLLDPLEFSKQIKQKTQTPKKKQNPLRNPESNSVMSFENQQEQQQEQYKRMNFYYYLNLLKTGTNFSSMIFILARYYQKKIQYITDFNIALAADISLIYYYFNKSLTRPFVESQLIQVESLHQTLYNVFYNTYFGVHLIKFVPKWINTDLLDRYTSDKKHLDKTTDKSASNESEQWNNQQLQNELNIFQDISPNRKNNKQEIYQFQFGYNPFQLITTEFSLTRSQQK